MGVGQLPRAAAVPLVVAAAATAARLPFVGRPLSSDEGGFLLVAGQWSPGRSLYGNYWVDRPPLLIAFFGLADRLGGAVALRLLGAALAAAAVLLAARVGRLVADRVGAGDPHPAVVVAALTSGVFLASPLVGSFEVDGELVAVPLVLLGLVLLLEGDRAALGRRLPVRRLLLLVAAGVVGAAAALVKQNELDVLLAAGPLLVLARGPAGHRAGVRRVVADLAGVAIGAVALTALVVLAADVRGTEPGALWDAVVTFRLQAGEVIRASASAATGERFRRVLVAGITSGAVLLPVVMVFGARRWRRGPAAPVLWTALVVVGWEVFTVAAGGSYWLHYLVALVPGLVLCGSLAAASPGRLRIAAGAALGYAALVATVALAVLLVHPVGQSKDGGVDTWLVAHARPGDTAVVAYGHPDILESTGMSSPYPGLWSLPVRVRDPRLTDLATVLAGSDRPTWVVTMRGPGTTSLGGWGIDPARAQSQLDAHYRSVAEVDGHLVYLERGIPLATSAARAPA
ncbi:hypothetical protein EKO23_21060 [Nocardioides guangzhouensis]|uniref:Glycosyltransferase RgtA/B/C/D-like domain-containing protein n=1 Tax=Nocardioides guangzhouensis TaxID=2497878 RepID=A0A4Q4Z6P9_9ACTN|nr:hypothetical protein [Nocardioides guangzhouensis]RYP82781.1 hypothetical protein EKO23_21060 [Nocardioides guangzhouensis]